MDPATIAAAVLALIAEVQPYLGVASVVGKIIDALEAIIPILVSTAKNLIPIAKDAIATLRGGNVAITADQLDQLDTFESQLDAAFDQSNAAAAAEEQAASSTSSSS